MLLVDGHNLIGRVPGLSLSREEEGRETVLRRISAAKASSREPVLVVFDGRKAGGPSEQTFGGTRVVFSPSGRSADDEILRRLASGNPRASTVITSDKGLGRRARELGARVESCEVFWKRIEAKPARSRPGGEGEKPVALPDEVDDWLTLFSTQGKTKKHKI